MKHVTTPRALITEQPKPSEDSEVARSGPFRTLAPESCANHSAIYSADNSEQLSHGAEILERFLAEIVNISPERIAAGITVHRGLSQHDTTPQLEIRHTQEHQGRSVEFSYVISPTDGRYATTSYFSYPNLGGEIGIPYSPWTPELRDELRSAWKRITIADPILYDRHWRASIVPEPYQVAAADTLLQALLNEQAAFCSMATATGKTVVAMMVWDRYREILVRMNPEKAPGKLLFIVNRNLLLSEAQQKLDLMYPNKYTVGRVYDGECTVNADVIFATESSLEDSGKILTLIQDGSIALVVRDEAHHLPAARNARVDRRVEDASEKYSWGTAKLGLTATPYRRDELSVTRFFNRDVTFEYSKQTAFRDGNLVGFRYVPADVELDPSAHLFDRAQYPHIWEIFRREVATSLDKRSLFICRKMSDADELANWFNERAEDLGEPALAVALHTDALKRTPELFEHSYYAWKHGEWPPKSRFKNRPVPTVVMAVGMFGEGIDVPEMHNLFLWENIASLSPFVQALGRALRAAPFKLYAKIVDLSGSYKNEEIRTHLDLVAEMMEWHFNEEQEIGAETGANTDRGPVVDYAAWDTMPEYLAYMFGSYDSLPRAACTKLDQHFVEQLALAQSPITVDQLSSFAIEIADDMASERRVSIRRALRSVFDSDIGFYGSDLDVIPRNTASLIIFLRLADLIFSESGVPTLEQSERLAIIFPEFSAAYETILRNRARNLTFLRRTIFAKDYEGMAVELLAEMESERRVSFPSLCESILKEDATTPHLAERGMFLRFAEGDRERHPKMMKSQLVCHTGKLRVTNSGDGWQQIAITAYTNHKIIHGRLTSDDFSLGSLEFKKLIRERGVFASTRTQIVYVTSLLLEQMNNLMLALKESEIDRATHAATEMVEVLSPDFIGDTPFWKEFPRAKIPVVSEWLATVTECASTCLHGELADRLLEVAIALQNGLTIAGARNEESLLDDPREGVVVSLDNKDRYLVSLKLFDSLHGAQRFYELWTLEHCTGYFGRGVVKFTPVPGSKIIHSIADSHYSQILDALGRNLTFIEKYWGNALTYLLPNSTENDELLSELKDSIRKSNRSVIPGVRGLAPEVAAEELRKRAQGATLRPTETGISESYLPYVNDEYILFVKKALAPDNLLPPTAQQQQFLEMEVACGEYSNIIAGKLQRWDDSLRTLGWAAQGGSNQGLEPVCNAALTYLTKLLHLSDKVIKEGSAPYFTVSAIIHRIVDRTFPLQPDGDSVQLRIISAALREMAVEGKTVAKFGEIPPSSKSVRGLDLKLLSPVLRDWGIVRYYIENGSEGSFPGVRDQVEVVLREVLVAALKRKPLSQRSTMQLADVGRMLQEHARTTNNLPLHTAINPLAEGYKAGIYFTELEGSPVLHRHRGCPAAAVQVPITSGGNDSLLEDARRCRFC